MLAWRLTLPLSCVQMLVHVLAALALMGLGCLWLIMNLSAEFAHARRDMKELPGRSPTALTRVRVVGGMDWWQGVHNQQYNLLTCTATSTACQVVAQPRQRRMRDLHAAAER